MTHISDPDARRKSWMGLLAKAPAADLSDLWARYAAVPRHTVLRAPEIGGVMARGGAGAVGAPFNLGEITVTRCSIMLADGTVGYAYVQGRDRDKALQAALVDALMQTGAADDVEAQILTPLRNKRAALKSARAARAAATRVEFFTMVRGET